MNILHTNVSVINKFLNNFKGLFSNKQFTVFKMSVSAMLKIINALISFLLPKSCISTIGISNLSFQTLNRVMKS